MGPQGLDQRWMGKRYGFEVPFMNSGEIAKKDIVPEILNENFMFEDDYYHYDDWKTQMG
jgi:hypothetical protein